MRKIFIVTAFIATCATLAVAASAGEAVYNKCRGCHGTDGSKKALGVSPSLKGQSASEIEMKLKGYADGSYGGSKKSLMKGQVNRLSAEEIKQVSEYISKF
jgi:cytochrome c